jgi:hypothetical protein
VLRIALACLGAVVAVVLIAAARQDPHLWGQLITALDHQARARGTSLDGQVARLVTPAPAAGSTP